MVVVETLCTPQGAKETKSEGWRGSYLREGTPTEDICCLRPRWGKMSVVSDMSMLHHKFSLLNTRGQRSKLNRLLQTCNNHKQSEDKRFAQICQHSFPQPALQIFLQRKHTHSPNKERFVRSTRNRTKKTES